MPVTLLKCHLFIRKIDIIHRDSDSVFIINLTTVFHKLQYMDYLTISGNFAATSKRLLQFSSIVAVT